MFCPLHFNDGLFAFSVSYMARKALGKALLINENENSCEKVENV